MVYNRQTHKISNNDTACSGTLFEKKGRLFEISQYHHIAFNYISATAVNLFRDLSGTNNLL